MQSFILSSKWENLNIWPILEDFNTKVMLEVGKSMFNEHTNFGKLQIILGGAIQLSNLYLSNGLIDFH